MANSPDLNRLADKSERLIERYGQVVMFAGVREAQRNLRSEGLVRSGKLVGSIRGQQRRNVFRVGISGPAAKYGNIYNFGGNVTQKTTGKSNPKWPRQRPLKGTRAFKVQRREWISDARMRPTLAAIEARLMKELMGSL
jgi:phage gpG-like protein